MNEPLKPPTVGEMPQKKESVPKLVFSSSDTLFAWLSVLMGMLLSFALPVRENPLGVTLCVLLLTGFGLWYLHSQHVPLSYHTLLFGALIVFFSTGFVTAPNGMWRVFLCLFLIAAYFYWIYTAYTPNGLPFRESALRQALQAIFLLPLCSVFYLFPAFWIREKQSLGGRIARTALGILMGLGCAVIPTVIIVLLLSYDHSFTSLLNTLFAFVPDFFFHLITDLPLALLIAALLFGVLFGRKRLSQVTNGGEWSLRGPTLPRLPRVLLCATVTPILFVYVLFFISQGQYYLSAFTGTLPEGLTYAAYAREGFFQLCWVSAINAILLLLFHLLMKDNGQARNTLRTLYTVLISLFTLVLIATALSKLILYIDSFGLTRKRVWAAWMVLMLGAFFVAILIRQLWHRLPLLSTLVILFVIFFGLMTLPNVDGAIASYNVNAYLSGDLDTVDVYALSEYDVSAIPALVDLKESLEARETPTEEEQRLLERTDRTLTHLRTTLAERPDGIFSFHLPTANAKAALSRIETP